MLKSEMFSCVVHALHRARIPLRIPDNISGTRKRIQVAPFLPIALFPGRARRAMPAPAPPQAYPLHPARACLDRNACARRFRGAPGRLSGIHRGIQLFGPHTAPAGAGREGNPRSVHTCSTHHTQSTTPPASARAGLRPQRGPVGSRTWPATGGPSAAGLRAHSLAASSRAWASS
jgi:hypothetical protein